MDSFSKKAGRDSFLTGLLLLSYAFLIFAIPIQNIFDFKAAKITFSLGFLVTALGLFFYSKLFRETDSKIAIPFIFKIYSFYVFVLSFSSLFSFNKCYDSLYYLAHFIIIGLLLIALYNKFNNLNGVKIAVFFMAGITGIVSVLGIMEYFGLVFYEMNLNSGQIIKGTFGNQNYLGGYLSVSLPFVLTLFFCSKKKILKSGFLLLCVFAVFCAFSTCSRITAIDISLCLAIYLLLASVFVFRSAENRKAMEQKKKLVIVCALIAGAALLGTYLVNDSQLIQRFEDISDLRKFFGVRIDMFKTAVAIWLENPCSVLFGNGIGSFYKLHFAKFPPDYFSTSFISFNHVHNEILENLVEGGIVAFVFYLFMNLSTLYVLQKVARDSSADKNERLIAVSFITSIIAFQIHGLFSISTRVLTGLYTFYWIIGLSWALFSVSEIRNKNLLHQSLIGSKKIKIFGLSVLLLLLLSGMKLGNFVLADTFLTKARVADMMNKPQAEYYYNKAIEVENKNIYAHYFLSSFYLSHGVGEGFHAFADMTEAIIPHYRTINYFRALMALIENKYEKSESLFEYYDDNIKQDDPLTMLWLTVLKYRKGNDAEALDYVKRYLMSNFKRDYDWRFTEGNEIIINKEEEGLKSEVSVGTELLRDAIKKIPVREGQDIVSLHREILTGLACLFEKTDFDLWNGLKTQIVTDDEHPFMAEKFKREIISTREKYEKSDKKEDLQRLITLCEGLTVYVPKYEQKEIRKRLLPLYLKDLQFKKYAYWKRRVENSSDAGSCFSSRKR
ncbi:MAG: O-antigen ligase family protein [Proteobacteria bacterium]|nr:O-antigen ligase family protein [Pseudomonadota bacterium]